MNCLLVTVSLIPAIFVASRSIVWDAVPMPSPDMQKIRSEWRGTVVDPATWKATSEERPGGEAEGFWVERGALRGYLKPSKPDAGTLRHPRAAHEKIAADLAFDLGLPVSPCVLVDGTQCGGRTQAAVVSLVLYPEVHKWAHAISSPSAKAIAHHILRSTPSSWSGMLAFDAWLANSDRNNQNNLVIGSDSHISEPVFCDFANSMLHSGWTAESNSVVTLPDVLPEMRDFLDHDAAMATAEKIRDFPIEVIQDVVSRIPDPYLQGGQKTIIIDALASRRNSVPSVIAAIPK